MIFINRNSDKIKTALDKHVNGLVDYVNKRLQKHGCNELRNEFTEEKIKEILSTEPELICSKNSLLNQRLNLVLIDDYKSKISKIFSYKAWIDVRENKKKYTAYSLAENLDIRTCTYCNRLYTKTVKGKKKKTTRPEFDHWFPKSEYPLYALSFYNLIPSCHVCNSNVKGSLEFTTDDYIHPYIDKTNGIKFSYYNKKTDCYGFKILPSNEKEKKTIQALQLEEIYKTHVDEIEDLVLIKKRYSESYINSLKSILKNSANKISTDEIYRLAFGVHINEDEFHKRPLSKMKYDILKELEIIK